MSLSLVRPYFRNALDGLGFVEHRNAHSFSDIPNNLIDQAYHLESGSITSGPASQLVHTYNFPITVRIFRRGYNDTINAHEALIADIDNINAAILQVGSRTTGDLKDVIPGAANIIPVDTTNDNLMIAEISYVAVIQSCFR